MRQATLEMRKRVTVKIGDELLFSPGIQATGGPEAKFFNKYDGMKARVLGFEEDGMRIFARVLAGTAGRKDTRITIGGFRVKFENGDEPKEAINAIYFLVP